MSVVPWGPKGGVKVKAGGRRHMWLEQPEMLNSGGLVLVGSWAGQILGVKDIAEPGDWSGISCYLSHFYLGFGQCVKALQA